jgi:Fe-S oxidoreductase
MGPILISLMLVTAFGFFAYFGSQKAELLLAGKPEGRLDRLGDRLKGFWQYGLMQQRLVRNHKAAGWMHAIIFWGFCVLLLRSLVMIGIGFYEPFHIPGPVGMAYTAIKDLFEVAVLVMVAYAVYRRAMLKPERLTNSLEAYAILFLIAYLMGSDFVFDSAKFAALAGHPGVFEEWQAAIVPKLLTPWFKTFDPSLLNGLYVGAYWSHVAILMAFGVYLTKSKHLHVITALPNVFFRALNQPALAIQKLDLADETAESFGVVTIDDLTWKQDLDLFSCTECGRCLSSCPTYVTHKPLSLKGLNDDLKHHLFAVAETKADGGAAPGEATPLVHNIISPDTIWACTTCGFCETACPVFIEQVPRIVSMRQSETLMEARYPEELKKLYTGLERASNPYNIAPDQRPEWAKDLGVATMAEAKAQNRPVELLYFVGCMASFDARNQKVAKALIQILQAADVKFAILGKEEGCTGDAARRLGNEYLFQELAQYNVAKFTEYDVKTVLTACPHCHNTIKNEYPQFGGNYRVIHHSEFIAELLQSGRIKVNKSVSDVMYHDSCYLGRYNGIYEQPRVVIDLLSTNGVKEFERNRDNSFCCGAGGGRMWMEETIGEQINQNRVEEGLKQKPKVIASGCPFCLTMMRDGVGAKGKSDEVQTKDIAELVAEALVGATPHRVPVA